MGYMSDLVKEYFPLTHKAIVWQVFLARFSFALIQSAGYFFCEITIPPLKVKWSAPYIVGVVTGTNRGNWELRIGQETVKSKSFSGLSRHMKTGCQ